MSDTNVIEMHLNVDNIYEQDSDVWSRLKRNAGKESDRMDEARELWPAIAADMARLREKYSADIEFGAALVMHEIEYDRNTRAAFVKLGRILNSALVDALELNSTRSPRLLAQWVKEKAESDDYYAEIGFTNCETDKVTLPEPEKQPEPPAIEPEPVKTPLKKVTEVIKNDHVPKQGKGGRKYIDIVNDFFIHKSSSEKTVRNVFGAQVNAMGKLILTGNLPESSNYALSPRGSITLRMLFEDYPKNWRYPGISGEKIVVCADEIIDHHTRCGADLSLNNCKKVAEEMRVEKIPTQIKPIYTAPAEPSGISHSEARPADVQDIIVAGALIWSETETKGHLYDDAWNTYQMFTYMLNDVPHDSRLQWARGSKSLGKFRHNIMLNSACDVWSRMATAVINDFASYATNTSGAEPATNHAH